jgi:hypothetical protein
MAIDDIIKGEMRRMKETRKSYMTAVAIYDKHIPYHSPVMEKITLDYIRDTKPNYIIDGGDLIDNPGMSIFDPDPNHRRDTQEEIDMAVQYLARLHEASPESKIILIPGNHDVGRLERLKTLHGFGLKNLRSLDYVKLIKESAEYQGVDIGDVEFKEKFELGPGMVFVHGDPRMTPEVLGGVNGPKRTADSAGFAGKHVVYGHSHQVRTEASKWGNRFVHMTGASMDLNHKGYVHQSEYQNGILVVHYNPQVRPNPVYHVQNVALQPNNTMIIDGKEYRG